MKILFRKIIFLITLIICGANLYAQTGPIDRSEEAFYPDFYKDEDIKAAAVKHDAPQFTWGGWLTPAYIDIRENSKVLALPSVTMRLWGNFSLQQNVFLYLRIKDSLSISALNTLSPGTSSDNSQFDRTAYTAEKGIVSNLTEIADLAYFSATTEDKKTVIQFGRKFFILGTGLLLNSRGDGIDVNIYTKIIDIELLSFYTGLLPAASNPYNLTSRDFSFGAARAFAGLRLSKDIDTHNLYTILLGQYDYAASDQFNTLHAGLGIKGVFLGSLEYHGEFIYQYGMKTVNGILNNFNAISALANINYYFKVMLKPAILFQYAYGSGTKPVSAIANGFDYFGLYNGGTALRPKLNNIHILRAGASFVPTDPVQIKQLNRLTLMAKYSFYMKDNIDSDAGGGIGATVSKIPIGHGLDFSLTWSIFQDLSFFTSFGLFFPGDAMPSSESNRSSFIVAMNFSF